MKTARRVRKGACGKRPVATPAPRPRAYLAAPSRIWAADKHGDRDIEDRVRHVIAARRRKRNAQEA